MKANIEQVIQSLRDFGPMSISQIGNHVDLTHRQISSALSWLERKNQIFFAGTRKNDRKFDENIYTIEEQFLPYQEKKKPKEYSMIEHITSKPFSENEMHYGREGKRFSWSDIEKEALEVNYHPNNDELNYSPFKQF